MLSALAKDPKELDPVLADLSRYFNQTFDSRMSDRARAVLGRMQPAHRFVQHWQEYLAALKSGNVKEAQNALKRASNEQGVDLIPGSEIVDRLEKLSAHVTEDKAVSSTQIDEIVGKVKNPDGLGTAIAQLQDLRGGRTGSFSEALINTISALSALERMYSEFQAGLPFKFDAAVVHVPAFASTKIPALEAQVLLAVLPRYLKVSCPISDPKPGETVRKVSEQDGARRKSARRYSFNYPSPNLSTLADVGKLFQQRGGQPGGYGVCRWTESGSGWPVSASDPFLRECFEERGRCSSHQADRRTARGAKERASARV